MIIFAHINYLLLLLLVPLIPLGYLVYRKLRSHRMARLGDRALVRELMPSASSAKAWVRVILFSLAFGLFVIGLARPQVGAKLSEHEARGSEIMICLDVSNSMLARDYSPCRLDRAKLAISRIVDKLEGDRIGLIVFAGSSFVQLPITTDYVSAKMFMSSINTSSVPIQGTAMGDAIQTAAKSFSEQSEKSRAIIVITDGENHEDDPVSAANAASEAGITVYTIGVGSAEGQPIPIDGGLMKDKQGNIVVTRLDEDTLKEVAAAGKGAYVHAGNEEFGLNPIIDELRKMEDERFNSVVFEEYDEQYMYFFAAALALLALEVLIGERKMKRKLFFVMAMFLVFPLNVGAQTDRHEVRSGNRDFKKGKFDQSEIDYRKAVLKDSLSLPAQYNLASSLYRQENYDGAAQAMGVITRNNTPLSSPTGASIAKGASKDEGMRSAASDFHYNSGDIALQKKDYASAVKAFKESLLLNPDDLDAKENYIYAKKMLENQQGGGGGGSQDNQDNKDNQNQDQNQNQDRNQDQDNQEQDNDNQGRQPQPQQSQMSPQQAQQMLQAIQAKEKETQDKVNKEKAAAMSSRQKEKNW